MTTASASGQAQVGTSASSALAAGNVEDARTTRLRTRFGLDGFRPWQREAIDALLDGDRRVLVVAPTGGGKSLCYQFPATELEGTTLVVSPLVALMEDQVRSLVARGIPATWLSATVEPDERRDRLRRMHRGEWKLVYVAPERLSHREVLEGFAALAPPFVAIDEAHCISQWGHDFRPDYLRLGEILAALDPKYVLACTATATPAVRDEILARLGLAPERTTTVLRGFARPNLHLTALEVDGGARRKLAVSAIRDALGGPSGPRGGAIVYCATRRMAEEMAEVVEAAGYRAGAYHAGLDADVRSDVANRFAGGELSVVAATNAFGMGIDRPDIRCVVHVQAPGSIEAYYQEVGRAGRDGEPALGLLMGGTTDLGLRRRLVDLGDASPELRARQWNLFLDLMRYVEAGSCRHDFILRYFGDEGEILGGCGHCDVCERLEGAGGGERESNEADALIARKALAGVARARGRVGLKSIADMLAGATNPKLDRLGFRELSTFGLLAPKSAAWIVALLRRLVTAGLVDIEGGDLPLARLTGDGVRAMKGEAPLRVLLPDEHAGLAPRERSAKRRPRGRRGGDAEAPLTGASGALFDRLRETRLALAKDRGVPPYVICHDRTLRELAALKPTTAADLRGVHGMGPARVEAYGDHFLAVIARA